MELSTGNRSLVFKSILSFLKECNLKTAAKSLHKELKSQNYEILNVDSCNKNPIPLRAVYANYFAANGAGVVCNDVITGGTQQCSVAIGANVDFKANGKRKRKHKAAEGETSAVSLACTDINGKLSEANEEEAVTSNTLDDLKLVNGLSNNLNKKSKTKKNKRRKLVEKTDDDTGDAAVHDSGNESKNKLTPKDHFRRIDSENWCAKILKPELQDNSYTNKSGDGFAAQAARDLIQVRGKNFRHEKSKKKRSSWRGACNIDLGVNSFQFDDSD